MARWPIKRLWKESVSFRWAIICLTITILLTLSIFIYQELTKGPTFDNTNTTFNNQNFQGNFKNAKISITEIENMPDSPHQNIYTKEFLVSQTNQINGKHLSQFNTKIILPDGQIAYIPETLYGQYILAAYSNSEETDFYIVHKYRKKLSLICNIIDFSKKPSESFSNLNQKCLELESQS